jgi:hypothetical protein
MDAPPPGYTEPVVVCLVEETNEAGETRQVGGFFSVEEATPCYGGYFGRVATPTSTTLRSTSELLTGSGTARRAYTRGMARPSLLSDTLGEQIESDLAGGIPIAVVAQKTGVGRSTLHEWIATGRIERREKPDPLAEVAERQLEQEAPDLTERLRAAEGGLVSVVLDASRRGSW